jgi:LAS superfamily LD-carboxypeptidase LdcB
MYCVVIVTIAFLIVQTTGNKQFVPGVSTIIPKIEPIMAAEDFEGKSAVNTDCSEPAKALRPAAVGITHYRYPEANSSDLVKVGSQRLHNSAASAFLAMQKAAWSEKRVKLNVISGFRSIKDQAGIVNSKRSRGMSDKKIYSASSEPGYSEHHTGLAMDINSLEQSFGKTKEGQWLKANVKRFGFEISFPESRPNGVSYEPWHIRYVKANPKMFCWSSNLIK